MATKPSKSPNLGPTSFTMIKMKVKVKQTQIRSMFHLKLIFCRFNDLASLFLVPQSLAVKQLFHSPTELIEVPAQLIFFCVYVVVPHLIYGMSITTGLFVPNVMAGAAMGRLVNLLISATFPTWVIASGNTYALIGTSIEPQEEILFN